MLQIAKFDLGYLWVKRIVAIFGVIVTAGAAIATGAMLIHGHPAYIVLLAASLVISSAVAVRSWSLLAPRKPVYRGHRVVQAVLIALSSLMIAAVAWLVPQSAEAPALAAMKSDRIVTVTEDATEIVMRPTGVESPVGVFFQPGTRVDARAYSAILRPLVESGHLMVIAKQPLGVAFLSTGAFAAARAAHHPVNRWVVGGHSLGGLVAATDAETFAGTARDPVVGLLLFASYPATNMAQVNVAVLSISGSNDGLSTPAKIAAAKPALPAAARYLVVEGGVHAFFGDYGRQDGDGKPAISHEQARTQIAAESVAFVNGIGG
ncbi:alpha/beta hydrolase [Cryobacterium lyxosi]|uniref:Alpha/beta hydrolase n=1 Tax=Cryobacterium lyxosi TaxID=1259228 RepID=A0A4R8ZJ07_9MICO|nr:alpha/beta hydrolase [Cryobacterium lyxosi]TFD26664.1 alpha/beta hydrolase [Cryobacterium lyxosi]